MPLSLLQTKLYMPPPRPHRVSRPSVTAKLGAGVLSPLTLIAAPAGFGKTTLVSEWISQTEHTVAWLSLDEDDNDPVRFLSYVIAALQTQQPELGISVQGLLAASEVPPPKAILTPLLNDLGLLAAPLALVLDDYHQITTPAIHEALTFLLDHLPPQVHLCLATRTDPPLPLARWRVRNQLTEIRTDDLRFSTEETAAFLTEVMGLQLSVEHIAALEARTEGWIAGLQLAALSLQGVDDLNGFMAAFSGSHRYIVDYLMEEVLNHQSMAVQTFLLQTSILERLCGPLCNAVVKQEGDVANKSQAILEQLEHANLFLIPLDAECKWYRYHHLFAEVLANRLRQTRRAEAPILHQRASAWYEQQALWSEAIHHALAATDFAQAARLIERIGITLFAQANIQHSLNRWLAMLPAELVRDRPRLCLMYAWLLFAHFDYSTAFQRVEEAEAALQRNPAEPAAPTIAGEIAAIRAMLTAYRPGLAPSEAIAWGQQALATLSADQATFRCIAALGLGMAYMKQGDMLAAEQPLAEANDKGRAADNIYLVVVAAANQAIMQRALGSMRLALATGQEALAWVAKRDALAYPIVGTLYLNLADLLCEQNDLGIAERYAEEAVAHSDQEVYPAAMSILSRLVLMRVKQARGEWTQISTLMQQVSTLAEQHPTVIHNTLLPAITAQFQLAGGVFSGEPDPMLAAVAWAQSTDWEEGTLLSAYRFLDFIYLIERTRIARAQVFIAWARRMGDHRFLSETLAYLERQQQIAEAGNLLWFQIKIHLLQALAQHTLGFSEQARTTLTHALHLAQPEGFVRIFLDEGEPIRLLILDFKFWISESPVRAYANQLLAVFENRRPAVPQDEDDLRKTSLDEQIQNPKSSDANVRIIQNLVEPLSERELEILRLVHHGLSNREIAERLIITIGTVKKHLNNIFGKLGASHRTQAIARARDFNLL